MVIILLHTSVYWRNRSDKTTTTTKLYDKKCYGSVKEAKGALDEEKKIEYKDDYWKKKAWAGRQKAKNFWTEHDDDVTHKFEFVELEKHEP